MGPFYRRQELKKRKVAAFLLLQQSTSGRTRQWVHPINKARKQQGDYYNLVQELALDSKRFHNYFRMSAAQLEEVLCYVGQDICKQTTNYREPIEAKQRLAITLRYMASGDSMHSMAYDYRVGVQTVSDCILDTTKAIVKHMLHRFLPRPTEETWAVVARGFKEKWQFPNCIGALDGKHIVITAPPRSGSLFFNYKGTFSIVLLALVDANYRFLVTQCGDFGRTSDGGVFRNSALRRGLENNTLHVPPPTPLPDAEFLGEVPHVVIADAAFPLKPFLLKPFGGRNLSRDKATFNYRLSRARMTVEKAFGMLAARWRILLRAINMSVEKVDTLVVAACILHNFLTRPGDAECRLPCEGENLESLSDHPNRGGQEAFAVRDKFVQYFAA